MRLILASLAAATALAGLAAAPHAGAQDDPTWTAWVDRMPPGPPALHVLGTITLPHHGYEVTLTPSEPQGINPAILMLDLQVRERDGIHTQAVATREVRYDVRPYDGQYEQVTILRDGEMIAHIDEIRVTY